MKTKEGMKKLLLLILLAGLLGCAVPPKEGPPPKTPTPVAVSATPTPEESPVAPTPIAESPTSTPEKDTGRFSVVRLSLKEGGEPTAYFTTEADGVFLNFETEGIQEGVMLRSEWRFLGREADFSASEGQAASAEPGSYFVLDPPDSGWPVGDYEVALYIGRRLDRKLQFTIEQPPSQVPETSPTPDLSPTPAPRQAANYKELARQLVQGKSQDREKAEALYRWLAENVSYDTEAYFSGDYGDCTAEAVFKTRTGVCSGYANLFQAMAEEVGLESKVIGGFSKGYSFEPDRPLTQSDHAWNAVKIGGQWQLLDSTWGAGYIDGRKRFIRRTTDFWFMTPPEQFVYSHLPEEERWQLLDEPVGKEKYLEAPTGEATLFRIRIEDRVDERLLRLRREL